MNLRCGHTREEEPAMAESVSRLFGAPRSRRDLLRTAGVVAVGTALTTACAEEESTPQPGSKPGEAPKETFQDPRSRLSGDLKILLWSHFVPSHDTWFDKFAKDWGEQVGVNVTVDHIDQRQIPRRIAAEIQAGPGPRPHPVHRDAVAVRAERPRPQGRGRRGDQPLGHAAGAVPQVQLQPEDRQVLRLRAGLGARPRQLPQSLWEPVGLPNGPATWDELLTGGAEIKKRRTSRWAWACPRRSTPTWSAARADVVLRRRRSRTRTRRSSSTRPRRSPPSSSWPGCSRRR